MLSRFLGTISGTFQWEVSRHGYRIFTALGSLSSGVTSPALRAAQARSLKVQLFGAIPRKDIQGIFCLHLHATNDDMSAALKGLRSTLRLPSSKFPPRPDSKSLPSFLAKCDQLYEWQRSHRRSDPDNVFTLHDGPPYANGNLHVGHALNKITKDIICRTKVAQGRNVNYVPGWDCHGLPIELKALEKHDLKRGSSKDDPVKIRNTARQFAADTVEKQMQVFRSWGIMADWKSHWKTMDKDYELRQLKVFRAMAHHGLIVRRYKPVYWSPSSRTALAEAEIERGQHKSTAALVKFRIPAMFGGSTEPVHAVIWTTTPWTIPANQAIAINKDLRYLLVRTKQHGNLIVAQTRVEYLSEQLGEEVELLKTLKNEEILNCTYSGLAHFGPDALDRPIIHADFVTADDGTGLVHCAPGHGNEDFDALQDMIRSGRVSVKVPVDDRGRFTKDACPLDPSMLAEKYVFKEGNQAVLDLLRAENALISRYQFEHKYPLDWRTKGPIIIRATAQWFADISKIKQDVVASLEKVSFKPESGKSRLKSFVESRGEWCISRQRAWGVPIPALFHKETNEAILTPESIDHIIRVIEERGIDRWWTDEKDDPAWIAPGLAAEDYTRGTDTMDVWFDSGSSWSLMLSDTHPPIADVYLEGSDQHRGWFQSSILTAVAYQKASDATAEASAPFRQLITHGFTLDAHGKKMSKSIGNVVDPQQIINGLQPSESKGSKQLRPLGPDALRLWAASADWTSDVIVSREVIRNIHKTLDKYRLTMKILLGMLADFDPARLASFDDKIHEHEIHHRIALLNLYGVVNSFRQHMQTHEFHRAAAVINEWIARDVSAMYLESVKDSIYCDSDDSREKLLSQSVLYHIFVHLQQMLAPITPLLIEEIHEFTPDAIKQQLGHAAQHVWGPLPESWLNGDLVANLPRIRAVNAAVKAAQERAREDKRLGSSLACAVDICFTESAANSMEGSIQDSAAMYEPFLVVSSVEIMATPSSQTQSKDDMFTPFRQASTGEERQIARAGLVVHLNNAVTQSDQQQYIPKTEIYQVQEVEWPDGPQRGEIMAMVVVRAPAMSKCSRCWKYNVEFDQKPEEKTLQEEEEQRPDAEPEVILCHRCTDAVQKFVSLNGDKIDEEKKEALMALTTS